MIKPSASDLNWFVSNFIPTGWKENISNVTFIPGWVYVDFEAESKGIVNSEAPWYVREAITAYFKQWNMKYAIKGGCPVGEKGAEGWRG